MKKVLIVDDAYFVRSLIRRILIENGYEVVGEAKNGKEAVLLYFEKRPDVVLMDLNMPVMSGQEACRHIFSKDEKAKIVVVTGVDDPNVLDECKQIGVLDVLKKPFQPAFLLERLNCVFATTQPKQEEVVQEFDVVISESEKMISIEGVEDDFRLPLQEEEEMNRHAYKSPKQVHVPFAKKEEQVHFVEQEIEQKTELTKKEHYKIQLEDKIVPPLKMPKRPVRLDQHSVIEEPVLIQDKEQSEEQPKATRSFLKRIFPFLSEK